MGADIPAEMADILEALRQIRAPIQTGEYDLHRLVIRALADGGIACDHEVRLGPRCRIDLMAGGVGLELKRGKPAAAALTSQLRRYAASERVTGLIAVCERHVSLPDTLCGKPVRLICLNRLWGIAL